MGTTIRVSKARVEVHQGNSAVKYIQCVLSVVHVIEFICKFDTKWCQVPCLCCFGLHEGVEPSPLLNFGDTQSMYLTCGLMFLVPVFQFAPQTFTHCLLGTTWQSPLSKYSLKMFPKHLLGDPQVQTVHDANTYHVQ